MKAYLDHVLRLRSQCVWIRAVCWGLSVTEIPGLLVRPTGGLVQEQSRELEASFQQAIKSMADCTIPRRGDGISQVLENLLRAAPTFAAFKQVLTQRFSFLDHRAISIDLLCTGDRQVR